MPILCKASEQPIQPDVPSSSMVPSGADPYETGTFGAAARCGIPACPRVPVPSFPLTARALPSPRPLFSPLSEPAHRALAAAVRELARTCPPSRKGRQRRHRPLPAKNRNFLDLWQTIAQDLSRLFAVPGCCPPCSGSPKGWPGLCHRHALATEQGQSLRCFRRSRARSVSVAATFRKALRAAWPEDGARADTDMTTRQGRTPFRRAAPPQHRGTGAGWLPEALRHSPMDLNKKFWQG